MTKTLLPVGVVLAAILSLLFFPNINGGTPMNESTADNPIVLFETTMGQIKIELDMQNAPNTSENFLAMSTTAISSAPLFTASFPSFMIQGGGITEDMAGQAQQARADTERSQ